MSDIFICHILLLYIVGYVLDLTRYFEIITPPYAFIKSQKQPKTEIAKTIIKTNEIIISSQIINEISINLLRKANFEEPKIRELILSFYRNYVVIDIDSVILLKASKLREKHNFSFWDSLGGGIE